jgi:acetoin utilization deacetylase AcuC-like enzyme
MSYPESVVGQAGYHLGDGACPVTPTTLRAALASAASAAHGASLALGGEKLVYALCRPPGHHATPSGFGGSCYLNNAALAAHTLRAGGAARVGIVDLDAHQGNGTAAIFYDRADVCYGSVHVDPGAGWFPHFLGFTA